MSRGAGRLLLGAVDQLVLVGALVAGADALVLPQSLGVLVEFLKDTRARFRVGACAGTGPAPGAWGPRPPDPQPACSPVGRLEGLTHGENLRKMCRD